MVTQAKYVVSPLAIANGTLRGILVSENCCLVDGRWTVDRGLGTYGELWLEGKCGGEQLMPPSIALLSTPLAVFSPFSLGYCCNIQDINIIFFCLGHTAEGSTWSKHTARGWCCYSVS